MEKDYYNSVAEHEKLLAFQDFHPVELKKKCYETVPDLISKANKWLESHPEYAVKTIETFNIKIHKDGPDPDRMSYMRKGTDDDSFTTAGRNHYLRCLRIWLIPHMSSSYAFQIGVKTFTPGKKTDTLSQYQNLDHTLKDINDSFRMKPIEGRILSVETKPVKLNSNDKFDPNKTNWSEPTDSRKIFVFVIRIFYSIESLVLEGVNFKDFSIDVPWTTLGNAFREVLRTADKFDDMVKKVHTWFSENQGEYGRISNIHSIDIKVKVEQFSENRKIMSFTEHNEKATFYWRALRVVCLIPLTSGGFTGTIENLSYKTFSPVLLTNKGKFESMSNTFNRIHAWLSVVKRSCQVSINSVETFPLRFNTGGEKYGSNEVGWTVYKGSRDERWIYIIRIYFDGSYTEPLQNSLPYVPPVLEKNLCHIQ